MNATLHALLGTYGAIAGGVILAAVLQPVAQAFGLPT